MSGRERIFFNVNGKLVNNMKFLVKVFFMNVMTHLRKTFILMPLYMCS